jgi:hypothetical protein
MLIQRLNISYDYSLYSSESKSGPLLDFAGKFHLETMKSGNPAFYLLREQFESFAVSPRRLDACDRIAHCLNQLEQFGEAGGWYEAAGQPLFAKVGVSPELRALSASEEYERALGCYRQSGNEEAEARCSEVVESLRKACSPN